MTNDDAPSPTGLSTEHRAALDAALSHVAAAADSYAADLADFVTVPSVSTVAEHRADIDAAAAWVAARLRRAGLDDVLTLPTAGHPVVVGRLTVSPDARTVIIYGHYDVQPPEPLELWDSPPFEPEVRGDKLYGRGACDDKAGVLIAIQAVEAYLKSGSKPPVNVTFLIEGEEEIGSPNLQRFISDNTELLKADLAISADGGIYAPGVPSVTVGSRGLAGAQLKVTGANADLHSGMYGGAVANPLMALSRILIPLTYTAAGQFEHDPVHTIRQRRKFERPAAQAQSPGGRGQRAAVGQAQEGGKVSLLLRAVGPEQILGRQPFAADDDLGIVRPGDGLLHAQRHAVAGNLDGGGQQARRLEVDKADAGHVAHQVLDGGHDTRRADGGHRESEDHQQPGGDGHGAMAPQAVEPARPRGRCARRANSVRHSLRLREQPSLQAGDKHRLRIG